MNITLNKLENNFFLKYAEKSNINQIFKIFETDILRELDKKPNTEDITRTLNSKADVSLLNNLIQAKSNTCDLENLKNNFESSTRDIKNKIGIEYFHKYINETKLTLEEMQKDIILKANFNELYQVLKSKAEIDEVNKALKQIHSELDVKTSLDQVFLIFIFSLIITQIIKL